MFDREKLSEVRAAVKREAARRSGYGDISAYAGSDYDADVPNKGNVIRVSEGMGIIAPLLAVQDYGDLTMPRAGQIIPDSFNDEEIITYVNALSAEQVNGSTSSCRSACAGLCVGTCYSTCSGCSNECSGGCMSGCSSCNGCTGCYSYN